MRLVLLAFAVFSSGCFLRATWPIADARDCQRSCDEIAAQCATSPPEQTACEDPAVCEAQCTIIESLGGVHGFTAR
jgi:hypothetical protein